MSFVLRWFFLMPLRSLGKRFIRSFFLSFACISACAFFSFLSTTPAHAAINQQINYQGRLLDSSGTPVADGTYDMRFRIYDGQNGTTFWNASGTQAVPLPLSISVTNGLFTVVLGDTTATGGRQNALTGFSWDSSDLTLGIRVGTDAEMTPGKHLTAVPQAFNAAQLNGMKTSDALYGTASLFTLTQTESSAATGTRATLNLATYGTSRTNDLLIRGMRGNIPVFSVNAYGDVSGGDVTSTRLSVANDIDQTFKTNSTLTSIGGTGTGVLDGSLQATFIQGNHLYAARQGGFFTFDLTDTAHASSVSELLTAPTESRAAAIQGSSAIVVGSTSPRVLWLTLANPARPQVYGYSTAMDADGAATAAAIRGRYAFVTHQNNGTGAGFYVFDLSDPSVGPRTVAHINTGIANPLDIAVYGNFVFIADETANQVRGYNISDPTNISATPSFTISVTNPSTITVRGGRAYVSSFLDDNVKIFDIANPSAISLLGSYAMGTDGKSLVEKPYLAGRYLYAALFNAGHWELEIYDIDSPSAITKIVTTVTGEALIYGLAIHGGYAYVADTTYKVQTYDLGGMETKAMLAHTADVGQLTVAGSADIGDRLNVGNELSVGIGGILSSGPVSAFTSSTASPSASFVNTSATSSGAAWGAYVNRLLVGVDAAATGTADYAMVVKYNDGASQNGLCLDDVNDPATCLSYTAGTSISANGTINATAFDLAERYSASGSIEPGDLLVLDRASSTTVRRSTGTIYDKNLVGIASTNPGLLLGHGGNISVALSGRVPTRVSPVNGAIAIGDPLTSSPFPGIAMKATKPGRVIGYALEAANATSSIEVFVRVGYEAGGLLGTDGTNATVNDHLVVAPQAEANGGALTMDSWGLTFRGSAWDGLSALPTDFTVSNHVVSATSSQWSISRGTSSLFSVDQSGAAQIAGDLVVGGRIFPATNNAAQLEKYIFLDNRVPGSTYMATNADGWQANDSYDFAERYYSPDNLEPGDLVVVSQRGQLHVQCSGEEKQMVLGVVSTKPAFVAGAATTSTFPIALAGRVPTKVSTMKGAIQIGDLVAASTIPGVAVKATGVGPVVGQALEAAEGNDIHLIEVFVNPGWWGGTGAVEAARLPDVIQTPTSTAQEAKSFHGFARIAASAKKVHISYPTLGAYPLVQVTPRGDVEDGWWTDNYSDTGFDIILRNALSHEINFSWQATAAQETDNHVINSDGTTAEINFHTGDIIPVPPEEEPTSLANDVAPPVEPPTEQVVTSTTPVVEEATSMGSVTPPAEEVTTSTTPMPPTPTITPEETTSSSEATTTTL